MDDVKIELYDDYYDVGYDLYDKKTVTIKPGLTVLVGCNGAGKSTLLKMCEQRLHKKEDTIVIKYSNQYDGGDTARERALLDGNCDLLVSLFFSSEGEAMSQNLGTLAKNIGAELRRDNGRNVWLLLDAMDSGYSVDNVVEMKNFFADLQRMEPERTFYILMPANAYELARGERCLDVQTMEYIQFDDYEAYRSFVLQSREKRNALMEKAEKRR